MDSLPGLLWMTLKIWSHACFQIALVCALRHNKRGLGNFLLTMVPTRKPKSLESYKPQNLHRTTKIRTITKIQKKENSGNHFDFRCSDNRVHNIKSQLNALEQSIDFYHRIRYFCIRHRLIIFLL